MPFSPAEPPLLSLESSQLAITVKENATLTCTVTGGYPPVASISIVKLDDVVASTTLGVLQVTTSDDPFGEYVCIANNSVLVTEEVITIKEKGEWMHYKDCNHTTCYFSTARLVNMYSYNTCV